ncbi:MAG: cytochrome C oxidase subunit IV family protein [Planctomycetales bacterium]|nr:cytochrome C oxidase subunit IV family protein [Planctomycetales bacterium]
MASHSDHDHHDDHGGNAKYVMVFIALCLLTSASFMTFFPFWHDNISPSVSRTFMMAVSCMKALLVMGFFMHLIWEANWKYVLTIPAGMMSIFLILMLVPDVGCRYDHYSQQRLLHAADEAAEEQGGENGSAGDHATGDHATGNESEHAAEGAHGDAHE